MEKKNSKIFLYTSFNKYIPFITAVQISFC